MGMNLEKGAISLWQDAEKKYDVIASRHFLASPILFWKRSLKKPMQICSLFPSSPSVGQAFVEAIRDRPAGAVIELGAGTGPVTRALLEGGVSSNDLVAVELEEEFCHYLQQRFPDIEVLNIPGEEIRESWKTLEWQNAGAVVSTLPIKLFDAEQQSQLLWNVMHVMHPDAAFFQLTYRLSSPVKPEIVAALGLTAHLHRIIWRNMPPAFIWEYSRKDTRK